MDFEITAYALFIHSLQGAVDRLCRGSEWAAEINLQATNCKAIVIVWTPEWEASGHCTAEYKVAKRHGAAVFVVLPETGMDAPPSASVLHAEVSSKLVTTTDTNPDHPPQTKIQCFYMTRPEELTEEVWGDCR